jgi:hypothetical protein
MRILLGRVLVGCGSVLFGVNLGILNFVGALRFLFLVYLVVYRQGMC